MNISQNLSNHARFRPNHTAFIFGERRESYFEFNQSVNRVANALQTGGIRKGDKVATLLTNCGELWELYWAAAKIGAVVVPLSPLLRGKGLSNLLNNADTAILITKSALIPHLELIKDQLRLRDKDIWLIDRNDYIPYSSYPALVKVASSNEPIKIQIAPDDLYNIIYSSGTTGEPKGIMHTHFIRAMYMTLFGNFFRMQPESVVLHTGAIIFNGSFLTLMPSMFLGSTFILHPQFDVDELIRTIKEEKVTHTILVPSQLIQALQHPDFNGENIASLEYVLSVGAPLHPKYKKALNERIPGVFYELYGLTEGFVTVLDKNDFHKKMGSVGCPPSFFEMKIVDDEGKEVKTGEVGEIIGKGPIMMTGYYKDPKRTASAIKDGWLYTGDIGYVDEDGYLFLVDRKKDLIISGGVNVYPKDIEGVLIHHPAIKEVVVIGVPDERWGETPVAAVVLKPDHFITTSALKNWANDQVDARYQKISDVLILKDFPRNVAGKILKRTIKQNYLMYKPKSCFIETNGIQLHYLDYASDNDPIILMHGLTANAHCFDGYITAGLHKNHRILSVDLRGRGKSDKPDDGYSMQEHAKDIIGLMDSLSIEKTIIGGHSFGALLSMYLSHHYPDKFTKVILIDAAARLHPNVREMVGPAMLRLGQKWASFEDYMQQIKAAQNLDASWEPEMESYFYADITKLEDGSYTTQSSLDHITKAINGALGPDENWLDIIKSIPHPTILINGTGGYGGPNPLLPKEFALETVQLMKNCNYIHVPGHHVSMLYGAGAKETVKAIEEFCKE